MHGLTIICVGLLFVIFTMGASLGLVYLLKEDRPKSRHYDRSASRQPMEVPPWSPAEWSAARLEGEPYAYFDTRKEAEDFACGPDSDRWVHSEDTGWIQVKCGK